MAEDIVYTSAESVSCKGSTTFDGHPKVYYPLSKEFSKQVCAYCGRQFIYDEDAERKTDYP